MFARSTTSSRVGRTSRFGLSTLALGVLLALGASAPAMAQYGGRRGHRPARPVQVGHVGHGHVGHGHGHAHSRGHARNRRVQVRKSYAVLEYERGVLEGKSAGYSAGYNDGLGCVPYCDTPHRAFNDCNPNYIRGFQIGFAKAYSDGFCAGQLQYERRTVRRPQRRSRWSWTWRW